MATKKSTNAGARKSVRSAKPSPQKATRKASGRKASGRDAAPRTSAPARRAVAKKAPLSAIDRLREICLALPETQEVEAWGEPTFRVKNKIFAMHASAGTHHSPGRPAVWILSISMEQDLVLRARPDKYFKPPYVGPSGWIGAWLDRNPPWSEIEELLRDGWRRRAPKKIAALTGW